jgi:hypothetical protein
VGRPTEQAGDFAIGLRRARLFLVGCSTSRHDREGATARQRAGEPKRRGLALSCACWLGDAVDPATFLFG